MVGIVQEGGVLDQQILPRLLTPRQRLLPVELLNLLQAKLDMIQQPVNGFELLPLRKSLGQCAGGRLRQGRRHLHQTIGTPSVSQCDRAKFCLCPLGGQHQTIIIHEQCSDEEPTRRCPSNVQLFNMLRITFPKPRPEKMWVMPRPKGCAPRWPCRLCCLWWRCQDPLQGGCTGSFG